MLAYVNIFSFAREMSKNEFSSQVEYSDRYVARHSIIIRGVNRKKNLLGGFNQGGSLSELSIKRKAKIF